MSRCKSEGKGGFGEVLSCTSLKEFADTIHAPMSDLRVEGVRIDRASAGEFEVMDRLPAGSIIKIPVPKVPVQGKVQTQAQAQVRMKNALEEMQNECQNNFNVALKCVEYARDMGLDPRDFLDTLTPLLTTRDGRIMLVSHVRHGHMQYPISRAAAGNLKQFKQSGPLTSWLLLEMAESVLLVLMALEQASSSPSLYHYDIKPANILVFNAARKPGRFQFVLADFGSLSRANEVRSYSELSPGVASRIGESKGSSYHQTLMWDQYQTAFPVQNNSTPGLQANVWAKNDMYGLGKAILYCLRGIHDANSSVVEDFANGMIYAKKTHLKFSHILPLQSLSAALTQCRVLLRAAGKVQQFSRTRPRTT